MDVDRAEEPAAGMCCPCGAPVPDDLPAAGLAPVTCRACGTPLVRPGRVPKWRWQQSLIAAWLVAIACALLWMLTSRATGSGAPIVVALAGGLVGMAARMAGRARGTAVQIAAFSGFLLFVLFGEALLFSNALQARLVAMHAEEGAADPELEARHEMRSIEELDLDERVSHFLRVEVTLGLFLALTAGGGLALLLTRAPPAVAAFERHVRETGETGDADDSADEPDAPRPPPPPSLP